jgi:hypothetical protein
MIPKYRGVFGISKEFRNRVLQGNISREYATTVPKYLRLP